MSGTPTRVSVSLSIKRAKKNLRDQRKNSVDTFSGPTSHRKSVTKTKLGTVLDLFRETMLLDPSQHEVMQHYCMTNHTETALFTFDALQDLKETDGQQKELTFLALYDMYLDPYSANKPMEVEGGFQVVLEEVVERIRSQRHTLEELEDVILELEKTSVRQLVRVHNQFANLKQKQYSETRRPNSVFEVIEKKMELVSPGTAKTERRKSKVQSLRDWVKRRMSIRRSQ
jgi:hypothetical protein